MASKSSQLDFFSGSQGEALKELVEALWEGGFCVYLAGGAVRDQLLGRPYKDLDVVTDASVEQIQSLFSKTIPVGIQFGIVKVLLHGHEFEVARFRSDGPYKDGRHPESIQFMGPKEDAERRDFTINALFYDFRAHKILDFVNGRADLEKQIIRTIGDPQTRFREDYLRILRALRFSCQLHFKIHAETEKTAMRMAYLLPKVSGERLCVEITKSLLAHPEKALKTFQKWNLSQIFFPHWNYDHQIVCNALLADRRDSGWLLSQWILNFQRPICMKAVDLESVDSWKYNNNYLSMVNDIIQFFKLSKVDFHQLKLIGTVYAWPALWNQFRFGFRGYLSQSPDFQLIFEAATQLNIWDDAMIQEVEAWRVKPNPKNLILGEDVIAFPPHQRKLVLSESVYLQYEGVLLSRSEALEWLKEKLQNQKGG